MNTRDSDPKPATQLELRSILGDLDDATALEILGLNPTVADLEEALMWSSGSGDVLGKAGRPLTGVAAQVFDVLARDEPDGDE